VDGIHDLGGMQGFGPIEVEADEPVFHTDWERRALGCTFTGFVLGAANGGQFRHSIERMDPAHYLGSSYYEHWLTGTATRLVETGRLTVDELEERAGGRFPLSRPAIAAPEDDRSGTVAEPSFEVGRRVRVHDRHPFGHTRCPGYVRGKTGTVVRFDGVYSVPDVEAHSDARRTEPTYCVRFDPVELWGDEQGGDTVHVDLWESYLEPVS
jgi:nitrile hydratase beta subunit